MQSIEGNTKVSLVLQIPMSDAERRRERLQQLNNGSPEDNEFERLILAVWEAEPGSFDRKRAIGCLVAYAGAIFKQLFKFSNKWKSYDQSAEIVYSRDVQYDALIYLSQNIQDFVPNDKCKSIKTSLKKWIEFNAINKGIDKFRSQARKDLKPLSLDVNIKAENDDTSISFEVSDDRVEGLDAIIARLDRRFYGKFKTYLQTDPEGKMAACRMKDYHHVNCSVLVQLLYFHEPPLNPTQAAKELGLINEIGETIHTGLRSHWSRSCLKLLKEIALKIAKEIDYEFD